MKTRNVMIIVILAMISTFCIGTIETNRIEKKCRKVAKERDSLRSELSDLKYYNAVLYKQYDSVKSDVGYYTYLYDSLRYVYKRDTAQNLYYVKLYNSEIAKQIGFLQDKADYLFTKMKGY